MNFQAFDIVSMEEIGTDYIWKSATALFSIYVFFVSERFLKFFLKSREVQTPPAFHETGFVSSSVATYCHYCY